MHKLKSIFFQFTCKSRDASIKYKVFTKTCLAVELEESGTKKICSIVQLYNCIAVFLY